MEASSAQFLEAEVRWQATPTARVAYRRFGSGPPLVIVHGWPLCGFTFREPIPHLAPHFTCYLLDMPGGGDTEWTDATDFTWPGQAATLKAFLEGIGLHDIVLYGQDSGAMICRQFALLDPGRIRKFVITNTEIPGHRPPFMRLFRALMFVPGTNMCFRLLMSQLWFVRTPFGLRRRRCRHEPSRRRLL